MDISKLRWSEQNCQEFKIPIEALPQIKSCSELFGHVNSKDFPIIQDLPITGYFPYKINAF